MSNTSIRLSTEAKDRLDLYKRKGESYEDVIMRLTEQDPWAGFGVLAETDTDTREGLAQIRASMRTNMTAEIEEDG